jgi:hypothetical protein
VRPHTASERASLKEAIRQEGCVIVPVAKATERRRASGIAAAWVVLGHRSPQVTEVHAELDVAKAAEVMKQLG